MHQNYFKNVHNVSEFVGRCRRRKNEQSRTAYSVRSLSLPRTRLTLWPCPTRSGARGTTLPDFARAHHRFGCRCCPQRTPRRRPTSPTPPSLDAAPVRPFVFVGAPPVSRRRRPLLLVSTHAQEVLQPITCCHVARLQCTRRSCCSTRSFLFFFCFIFQILPLTSISYIF